MPKRIRKCQICGHLDKENLKCKLHKVAVNPYLNTCSKYTTWADMCKCANCVSKTMMKHDFITVNHCKRTGKMVSTDSWCDQFAYDYKKIGKVKNDVQARNT